MSELISVIVPFFNEESHIERCARSLFDQTYLNIEFIFIDDNSSDNSITLLKQIIREYPHLQPLIKIVENQENKGSATSRNIGLFKASGKYIGWVDADDWVETDMFEKLYNQAKKENAEIVWSDYTNTYENHEDLVNQRNEVSSYSCIKGLVTGRMIGALWNKLILKSLYINNSIKFPDGLNMCEDLRVMVQLFYYSKKNTYLNGSFYHYVKFRNDTTSTSNAYKPKINQDWIENVKGIERFIEEKKIPNLEQNIGLMKLLPKKNLLIRGTSVEHYKQWRAIFSESNTLIWKSNLPFHYKIIAWSSDKQFWTIIRLWIFIKKTLKSVQNRTNASNR